MSEYKLFKGTFAFLHVLFRNTFKGQAAPSCTCEVAEGGVGWGGRECTWAFEDSAAAAGFPDRCAALALHERKEHGAMIENGTVRCYDIALGAFANVSCM